jgi:hypothetical protein
MIYNLDVDICSKENVNKKLYHTKKTSYYILNYDKSYICYDNMKLRIYRSVIISYNNNNVLCFSPPKSIPQKLFIEKYPVFDKNFVINEFIEGIMINLFYDKDINKWEIATKNCIGGKYKFHNMEKKDNENMIIEKRKTFYEMFIEALSSDENIDLNDIPIIKSLPKEYSYSFVLQHNNNVIILPVTKPQLYLVSVYCYIEKSFVEYVSPNRYERWNVLENISGIIQFPNRYKNICNFHDLKTVFLKKDGISKGIMIINTETGERTKIINYEYEYLKDIKYIQPNLQYQYFCLRRIHNKMKPGEKSWIGNFPSNNKKIYKINELYQEFINKTYSYYNSYYILKNVTNIPDKYFTHIFKLHHNVYLSSLKKKNKIFITHEFVRNYFDNMDPKELLYIMNVDRRTIL